MDRLRSGAFAVLMGGWLVVSGLAACSSDDFGTVGGSLPLDVSQDSLLVEISSIDILDSRSVVPELTQLPQDREILLIGNRPAGGWRATPFLRFDFSAGIADSILSGPEGITSAVVDLEMLDKDALKGITRDFRVHDLLDTLRVDQVDADGAATLLGDEITTVSLGISSSVFRFELPPALVWEWLESGSHRGIALHDLTADFGVDSLRYESNFVGFAGQQFRTTSLLDTPEGPVAPDWWLPKIEVTAGGTTFTFPVVLDFTIVERDAPADDALVLGSFEPSRFWLRFDLDSGLIPGDATINRALLSVVVNDEGTIGERDRTTIAYEALEENLTTGTFSSSDAVLRSASQVEFAGTDSMGVQTVTIDVTDFVQRSVNLVVPPEAGILVQISNGEVLRFDVVTFHGVTAAVELRPRLSVTFTPPADTWR